MSSAVMRALSKPGGLAGTVKIVVQALLLALVVRTFLFQPFSIPSRSMMPTLLVGDYLFVSKYSYGYSRYSLPFGPHLFDGRIWGSPPRLGDIAVFKLPRDNSTDYIKRVIGLPGDRIQLRDGVIYINGQPVRRERVADLVTTDSFGATAHVARYHETLPNGTSYLTLALNPGGPENNTPIYEVPADEYFMMGDNRDDSLDSRFPAQSGGVGFVPLENFVGRAEITFFSIDESRPLWEFWDWPWAIRFERLFSPL
jgi:signal peptidase I